MLRDFIAAREQALEVEAERLWRLVPTEFSEEAKKGVFKQRGGCAPLEEWLYTLIEERKIHLSYAPDYLPILEWWGWKTMREVEYAFDCLSLAWKNEIDVKVRLREGDFGFLSVDFTLPYNE